MCLSCFFSIRTKDQWALHLHSSFCFWFAPHNMTKYLLSTFLCPAAMRNWECSHVQYWNKNKEAVRVCKFKDRLVTQNWTLLRLTAKSTSLKAIMQVNWKPKLQKWTGSIYANMEAVNTTKIFYFFAVHKSKFQVIVSKLVRELSWNIALGGLWLGFI